MEAARFATSEHPLFMRVSSRELVRRIESLENDRTARELRKWLDSSELSSEGEEVDLVLVSPASLGLSEISRFDEIEERALSLGYKACPVWVRHLMKLRYKEKVWYGDHILNKSLTELVEDGSFALSLGGALLHVERLGRAYHMTLMFEPGRLWETYATFIYVRPANAV